MASWWTLDPLVLAGLATSSALYTRGVLRLWREAGAGRGISAGRALAYYGGVLIAALALLSPIDHASDVLFSAHMVQHELLMLVAAPLVIVGRPIIAMHWNFEHVFAPSRAWRSLTRPGVAVAQHAVVRLAWHVPVLFDAALADERIHAIQHLMFFASACVFWSALITGRYGRAGYGVAAAFAFLTMMYSGLLGAVLSLGTSALYAHAAPTLAWGLDPVEDQQRAGLIMWILAGTVMMAAGLALFAAWLGHATRVARNPSADRG